MNTLSNYFLNALDRIPHGAPLSAGQKRKLAEQVSGRIHRARENYQSWIELEGHSDAFDGFSNGSALESRSTERINLTRQCAFQQRAKALNEGHAWGETVERLDVFLVPEREVSPKVYARIETVALIPAWGPSRGTQCAYLGTLRQVIDSLEKPEADEATRARANPPRLDRGM